MDRCVLTWTHALALNKQKEVHHGKPTRDSNAEGDSRGNCPQGIHHHRSSEEGQAELRSTYGTKKYERLVALKNKYDPTNFFRLNHNIKPTA
jgi:Berberine and berberine like